MHAFLSLIDFFFRGMIVGSFFGYFFFLFFFAVTTFFCLTPFLESYICFAIALANFYET